MSVSYKVGEMGERPWGTWEVLEASCNYCVKKIYGFNINGIVIKDDYDKYDFLTKELTEIIEASIPGFAKKEGHPAKRTFQAIRIEVNDEIKPLYNTVKNSIEILKLLIQKQYLIDFICLLLI